MQFISPAGFSGGNWHSYSLRANQNRLYTPRSVNKAAGSRPIHFGFGMVSALIAEQTGQTILEKGIEGIISNDAEKLAKLGNLSKDANYRGGLRSLMLAQKLEQKLALIQEVNCEEDLSGLEKQDYLKKREAEQKKVETEMQKNFEKAKDAFLRTADSQHYEVLKMACLVYAAECAAKAGNDPVGVQTLCDEAEKAFDCSRQQLLEERADLLKPYELLRNIPRFILSSLVSVILIPVYLFSKPDTARKARDYLIKSGYGEGEFKRVEQNENLAKLFNTDSQGLLGKISSLRKDNSVREFNKSQHIPVEVPLLISDSASQNRDDTQQQ